ncbi:MAG: threonine synthase [Ignavibacteria bacterium GWB2_35_6b]|nr:MAG: threonine synthase [Ignavibacteria bacterium GWB2_35_6b]
MKFYTTNNATKFVTFKEAVLKGLAEDGGLFMPEFIPRLDSSFINNLENFSFQEIAFAIAQKFIEDEIEENDLKHIIERAINFPAPLVKLSDDLNILELFHGPTLAFKDFGARFMAETISHFTKEKLNILVATSGDTGSAVAGGFFGKENINVFLLYPSGKVSEIQEKQLTTWGGNITALEIEGTFDDCQRLVKAAFADKELTSQMKFSSANSISIARLLPQIFYYFEAYKQLQDKNRETIVCVPSGNLGNLTAGLFAKMMGLSINKFIAATNRNDIFTKYINTGNFEPRASVQTLSNAMDVGNPSNFVRIINSYKNLYEKIKSDIYSSSFTDDETIETIKEVYEKYDYVIDPHGAVGYLAVKKFIEENNIKNANSIVLESAHPAKFLDTVEEAINIKVEIPSRLEECFHKEKQSDKLSANYEDFKRYLLSKN